MSWNKKPTFATGCSPAAVAAAATAVVVPQDGLLYATTDVYTNPPTLLCIVGSNADAARALELHPDAFILDAADVLLHKGFIDALQQAAANPARVAHHSGDSLNICFHHAFGRCRGRRDGDATTCQQLHVRPAALAEVRRMYRNEVRACFVRSFVGILPPAVFHALAADAVFAPQTLNFAARDVALTQGARRVDAEFRAVLTDESLLHQHLRVRPLMVCLHFASGVPCPSGEACELLHVHLGAAATAMSPRVRDALLASISTLGQHLTAIGAAGCGAELPPYAPDYHSSMEAGAALAAAADPTPAATIDAAFATPSGQPHHWPGKPPKPAKSSSVSPSHGGASSMPPAPAPSRASGAAASRQPSAAASFAMVPASADSTHLLSDLAGYLGTEAPAAAEREATIG